MSGKSNESGKPKLIIFGDSQRPGVSETIDKFIAIIGAKAQIIANCFKGDCATDVVRNADFAIVFGGDGTILSAARYLSETHVPVIGVNVGIPAPVASLPFGGMRDSLFADIRAQGRAVVNFFTDQKIVTERYWQER